MFPPIEANYLAAEKIAEALLTQEEEVLLLNSPGNFSAASFGITI